jgi:IS30 family transposase
MAAHYKLNRRPREHFTSEQRLHLAREWNRLVNALCATLSFRCFAQDMGIDERSWRREYYRGGGSKPVWNPKTKHYEYGEYDPNTAQADANEKAAQKGPRQRLLRRIADEFRDLVREADRHRSLYDARCILLERHPGEHIPCLRTFYYHVEFGDIGLCEEDLVYGRRHRRKRNPAHPAKTVLGRRKLDDRPPEAVLPTQTGHLEMDTVVSCAGGKGGLLVLFDRLSRKYFVKKLGRVSQRCVLLAVGSLVSEGILGAVRSVVTDNGCEFLDQAKLDKAFGACLYYTRAYAAYEKGAVENCNRILRRWFPKGTDFSKVPPKRIQQVVGFINDCHRASLDGKTANQRHGELQCVA